METYVPLVNGITTNILFHFSPYINHTLPPESLVDSEGVGGQEPCPLGRTVPQDEYTEYHENVLQSYRYKQLNTQL